MEPAPVSLSDPAHLPFVSVIIPVYNGDGSISRVLDGLMHQTYPADRLEILVVDDGSVDETARVLARYAGARQVRLLSHDCNRGRAAARNTGLRAAAGDILLLLDADNIPSPDWVWAHVTCQQNGQEPMAGVGGITFAPLLLQYSAYLRFEEGNSSARHARYTTGAAVQRGLPFSRFVTTNASLSRRVLERIGEFDESWSDWGWEDTEYGYRLCQAGVRIRWVPQAATVHEHFHRVRQMCERMEALGREVAPRILAKHPHFLDRLSQGLMEPAASEDTWSRSLVKHLLQALVYCTPHRLSLRLFEALDPWITFPGACYKWLLLCFYRQGVGRRRNSPASAWNPSSG